MYGLSAASAGAPVLSDCETGAPARFRLRRHSADGDIHHVMLGEKIVGVIAFQPYWATPGWTWTITAISTFPDAGAIPGTGVERSREAAMLSWRRAWEDIEAAPHAWVPEPPEWRPGSWRGLG